MILPAGLKASKSLPPAKSAEPTRKDMAAKKKATPTLIFVVCGLYITRPPARQTVPLRSVPTPLMTSIMPNIEMPRDLSFARASTIIFSIPYLISFPAPDPSFALSYLSPVQFGSVSCRYAVILVFRITEEHGAVAGGLGSQAGGFSRRL